MTYCELYGIVERLTYKPRSSFVLKPHVDLAHGEGAKLSICQRLPNSKEPLRETEIRLIKTIPSSKLRRMDVMEFMSWLHEMLAAMEIHEINEWLKLDGKTLFDPHPEKLVYERMLKHSMKKLNPTRWERFVERWRATA